MKTTFEVSFDLDGKTRRDNFALHNIQYVAGKATELCDELAVLANKVLADKDWPGDFPTFPKDRLRYEQVVQQGLAPDSLSAVAAAIEPVLNRLSDAVTKTRNLVEENWKTNWKYELRQKEENLCIPIEPPPGGHIISTTLYFSTDSSTIFNKLNWSIDADDQVFTYYIDSFIKLQVVE